MKIGALKTIPALNLNPLFGSEKLRQSQQEYYFGSLMLSTMLGIFFDWQGIIHKKNLFHKVKLSANFFKGTMEWLPQRIQLAKPVMCKSSDSQYTHNNLPPYKMVIVKDLPKYMTLLDHLP